MMKQRTILMLFLSSMVLTGCELDKKSNDDTAVRFAAYQSSGKDPVTKVSGTDFDEQDEIAVFAPLAGNPIHGDYDPNASSGKGHKDMRYVADNNNHFSAKTEEDKIKYSGTGTKLDFYAVYPAMGPGPKYAVVDQNTYEIDLGDISRQGDEGGSGGTVVVPYIYSNNAKAKGTGDGVVTLVFQNVLSKIVLDLKYDRASLEGADLSKIEFYADNGLYRECVIDLRHGEYYKVATNGGREAPAVKETPYTFSVPAATGAAAGGNWTTGKTEGYIVPGSTTNPVIRLTFSGGGDVSSSGQERTFLCRIPAGDDGKVSFDAGKMYTYQVEITGTTPEVSLGGTIEDWVAAGGVPTILAE